LKLGAVASVKLHLRSGAVTTSEKNKKYSGSFKDT